MIDLESCRRTRPGALSHLQLGPAYLLAGDNDKGAGHEVGGIGSRIGRIKQEFSEALHRFKVTRFVLSARNSDTMDASPCLEPFGIAAPNHWT